MNNQKLEQVLEKVEPEKRSTLRKLVLGASFAVPVIASFSVKELASAATGSFGTTTTTTETDFITTFTFTVTTSVSTISTETTTITTITLVTVTTTTTLNM